MAVGERQGRPVIVSGSDGDRTVRVWDLESGKPVLGPLTGHDGAVNAVAVGERHGRPVIVSGGGDGTVRVWDLESGEPVLGPLTGHDGRVSAVAVGERHGRPVIVSGGGDGTVRVWDLESGKPVLGPLTGHDGAVRRGGGRRAARPAGHHLRQRRPDGAGVGPRGRAPRHLANRAPASGAVSCFRR